MDKEIERIKEEIKVMCELDREDMPSPLYTYIEFIKYLLDKIEKLEKVKEAVKIYLNYGNVEPNIYASQREKDEWEIARGTVFQALIELENNNDTN